MEGSINRLGETISNVKDLARILRRPDKERRNGSHASQPVLVRAGPGTGKTWMSKQAAYTLADQLGEMAESDVHRGIRMVPIIIYVQQIVYVLRDTHAPDPRDLLEVYFRKVFPEWHVAMLLQAYTMQALIMILDGVDEAAGMRKYIEDFVLRVLVPSGNRILITSRREGIADLTPYIELHFTVLDLKELSNEQQRSVIRAQMDGNEFFDHVLALGEMRRSLDGVWSTQFTGRERKELEGFFCTEAVDEAGSEGEVDGRPPPGPGGGGDALGTTEGGATAAIATVAATELPALMEPAIRKALEAAVARAGAGASSAPTFQFRAAGAQDGAPAQVICSSAALVVATLTTFADGLNVHVHESGACKLKMTHAVNRFAELDVTHFRFALCTLALSAADALAGALVEVHHRAVKQAAGGEGEGAVSAAEHYNFFRARMAHLASSGDDQIDRLLEPALIFLVDATGVPVLLSLLVLIFTSGGEDLSQLPKSQFELYQMGIQFAMDKRLLSSAEGRSPAAAVEASASGKLAYDDKLVTASLFKRWNKLFALDHTPVGAIAVAAAAAVGPSSPRGGSGKNKASSTPRGGKSKPLAATPRGVTKSPRGGGNPLGGKDAASADDADGKKKGKKEKVTRKQAGLGFEGNGASRDGPAGKKEMKAFDKSESLSNEDLYDVFRLGAKFLGAAARGVGRKELNSIELQMPKHLRGIVTTLVETNLKSLRDGSMHDVGLLMLRNLAILNQQNGRRQFGAGDVSQALLRERPCAEALTLWLHLNNEEGGIPLTKTLETQTDLAEGQYQFKHLSFQEGLFSQHLIMQAQAAVKPDAPPLSIWETDAAASAFLCDPFMNNTCRISAGILGALLAKRRPSWDFSSAPLTATGKRALWLLANGALAKLNLRKNSVGEDNDDANEGLAKLIRSATQLRELHLGSNKLGALAGEDESGWRRQQISRALSSSTSITELDLSDNDLRPPGVAVMCVALRALRTLQKLDLSFNWPGRTKELPELLLSHPAMTCIGVSEEPPKTVWQRVAYLDSRAKEKIGRTLLDRPQPILGFMRCDAFELVETTTALLWTSQLDADAVLLAGVLRANTVLTALNFGGGEELREDSKELVGSALLAGVGSQLGLCDAFGLRPGLTSAAFELNAKAKDAAAKDVVKSIKAFTLLCGILRGNKTLISVTLKSLKPTYCAVLGARRGQTAPLSLFPCHRSLACLAGSDAPSHRPCVDHHSPCIAGQCQLAELEAGVRGRREARAE